MSVENGLIGIISCCFIVMLTQHRYIIIYRCPWTGTAIGKKNMRSFQMFVALVFICLIMDIILLTMPANIQYSKVRVQHHKPKAKGGGVL